MANYLDKTGLGLVWGKIKSLIPTKLGDMSDVDSTAASHGNVLRYDNPSSTWKISEDYVYGVVTLNYSTKKATFTTDITPKILYEKHTLPFYVVERSGPLVFRLFYYENDSGYVSAKFVHIAGSSCTVITTASASKSSTSACTGTYEQYAISDTTYSLSMSGNVITLTPSSGTASSVTLPVYDGSVSGVLT